MKNGGPHHSWFWYDFMGEGLIQGTARMMGLILAFIVVFGTIFWWLG